VCILLQYVELIVWCTWFTNLYHLLGSSYDTVQIQLWRGGVRLDRLLSELQLLLREVQCPCSHNTVPRSDIIWAGFPNIALWESSLVMTSLEYIDFVGYSQQNLVNPSMTARMCLYALWVDSRGPKKSMCNVWSGSASLGNEDPTCNSSADFSFLNRLRESISIAEQLEVHTQQVYSELSKSFYHFQDLQLVARKLSFCVCSFLTHVIHWMDLVIL